MARAYCSAAAGSATMVADNIVALRNRIVTPHAFFLVLISTPCQRTGACYEPARRWP